MFKLLTKTRGKKYKFKFTFRLLFSAVLVTVELIIYFNKIITSNTRKAFKNRKIFFIK
jgi:hypothetical protein